MPDAAPSRGYFTWTTDEGCLSGHYWSGGMCSRCGERLRCGACGRFVTIENLTQHIDTACPVKWEVMEDDYAAA